MTDWCQEFTEKQIIEWRKKYLRYKQLENQIKIIEKTKGENSITSQQDNERSIRKEIHSNSSQNFVHHDDHSLSVFPSMDTGVINPPSYPKHDGTKLLQITIISAQNLPIMDVFGSCDAFCTVEFCGQHRSTSVKKNSLSPRWDESFALDVKKRISELCIKLLDWEMILGSDLVGGHRMSSEQLSDICSNEFGWQKHYTETLTDAEGKTVVGDNGMEAEITFILRLLQADLACVRTPKEIRIDKGSAHTAQESVELLRFELDFPHCITRHAEQRFFDLVNQDMAVLVEFHHTITHRCVAELDALHSAQKRMKASAAGSTRDLDQSREELEHVARQHFVAELQGRQLAEAYEQLYKLVGFLRSYMEANKDAILRILRKHDKVSALSSSMRLMRRVMDGSSFTHRDQAAAAAASAAATAAFAATTTDTAAADSSVLRGENAPTPSDRGLSAGPPPIPGGEGHEHAAGPGGPDAEGLKVVWIPPAFDVGRVEALMGAIEARYAEVMKFLRRDVTVYEAHKLLAANSAVNGPKAVDALEAPLARPAPARRECRTHSRVHAPGSRPSSPRLRRRLRACAGIAAAVLRGGGGGGRGRCW